MEYLFIALALYVAYKCGRGNGRIEGRMDEITDSLPPAEETKALPPGAKNSPDHNKSGGQPLVPERHYRESRKQKDLSKISPAESLNKLVMASYCNPDEIPISGNLKEMAVSLPVMFLVNALTQGMSPEPIAYVLKLRDKSSDMGSFRAPLLSEQASVRSAARQALADAYGWNRIVWFLGEIVINKEIRLELRREIIEEMSKHECGRDRLKVLMEIES
jgi:hypothetical protein